MKFKAVGEIGNDSFRMAVIGLTRFGQMQFSRGPVEQPRAELFFQLADLARYG